MTLQRLIQLLVIAGSSTSLGLLAATFVDQTISIPSLSGKPSEAAQTIRMTGMIEDGDASRLREMLTKIRKQAPRLPGRALATIELSSSGGDLLEGMKLGYLFREFDVATVVRARDSCLSACALAFLGGTASHLPTNVAVARTVEVGGTLGFHNFYLNPNSIVATDAANPREGIAKGFNQAKGAASMLVHYSASLGVDANFTARLLGRPPEAWEYADTAGAFIDLKICPAGVTTPLPAPPVSAVNICSNALGTQPDVAAARTRRMLQIDAKRHLLQDVQKNVAAISISGPLSSQLSAVIASRDDRLVDSVYADLRAAGLPLPEIIGPTFEVTGLGAGIYDLQCIASLSLDDPDRFDVVLTGPMGIAKPPNRSPPSCGRLFRFDRDTTLNPERK